MKELDRKEKNRREIERLEPYKGKINELTTTTLLVKDTNIVRQVLLGGKR